MSNTVNSYTYLLPFEPRIRIWGSPEKYPTGLYIARVDDLGGCFTFWGENIFPVIFKKDDQGSGALTTAVIGDFIFSGLANADNVEGFIYISEGQPVPPNEPFSAIYTIYVFKKDGKTGMKFGKYNGAQKEPTPADGVFMQMFDGYGNWLWLFKNI